MGFPIVDSLRGHPQGTHGTRPQNLVGFWIRDESVMYDFLGQAFSLMPDGRVEALSGMTERRWHFGDGHLFIDSVSRCGNCYRGNETSQYTIQFEGADQLRITNDDRGVRRGIAGEYRRVRIDAALVARMRKLEASPDEATSFKGRTVLKVIEQYEARAKFSR